MEKIQAKIDELKNAGEDGLANAVEAMRETLVASKIVAIEIFGATAADPATILKVNEQLLGFLTPGADEE